MEETLEASKHPVSPQLARSIQARENWLRSIEEEFGTLSRQEVGDLRGARGSNRNMAADLQFKGKIVAFRRGKSFRIPAFQFTEGGQIRAVIPQLIAVARSAGWDDQDLLAWLTNPNLHFPDAKRPVDCLDDVDRVHTCQRQVQDPDSLRHPPDHREKAGNYPAGPPEEEGTADLGSGASLGS